MTSKADFTEEEWDLVLEGPPAAGLIVSSAERGGTIREAFSIAKAYAEARKQHGSSELLDAIVSAKPEVDRARHSSLDAKGGPNEVDDYRGFVISVAEHAAAAKKEGDEPASEAERAAIAEIAAAVGRDAGTPS